MTKVRFAMAALICTIPTMATAAAVPGSVPEPETLALLAIGAVALIIAKTRKRK